MENLYRERHIAYTAKVSAEQRRSATISTLRVVSFLGFLVSAYLCMSSRELVWLIPAVLLLVMFLVLLMKHQRSEQKLSFLRNLAEINEQELGYLQGDLSAFNAGQAYVNPDHSYSYDLDIFGKSSLFQHIDRTVTSIGKEQLADVLREMQPSQPIAVQQQAIRELSAALNWRQEFLAGARTKEATADKISRFLVWLEEPLSVSPLIRVLMRVMPVLTIGSLLAMIFSDWPYATTAFSSFFMLSFFIVSFQMKKIKAEQSQLDKVSKVLFSYSGLLERVEQATFEAPLLRQLQAQLQKNDVPAGRSVARLSSILNQLDSIGNVFAVLLFNGLFMYHLQTLRALAAWKNMHRADVAQWFRVIAKFDSLVSLANYAANHPSFCYPVIEESRLFKAEDLGHPLIREQARVGNSIDFNASPFVVLTGSNMSGKSTFLRTIGINMVMAKVGLPVCARSLEMPSLQVYTSMRVTDSLQENESYFFSELKRLKMIIDHLEDGRHVFVILDEILRGTNSNDKYAGTVGLIRSMIARKGVGIIATHDLTVGKLQDEHPNYLSNKCFEVEIRNEELYFDYKLKEGICQKMSATFLLKQMQII